MRAAMPLMGGSPEAVSQPPGPHAGAPPRIPRVAGVLGLANLALISDWLDDTGVIVSSANGITVI